MSAWPGQLSGSTGSTALGPLPTTADIAAVAAPAFGAKIWWHDAAKIDLADSLPV